MSLNEKEFDRQINHKTMRVIVGLIAILLAPITYLLAGTIECAQSVDSISATYFTNSGDLFVGSLVVVGFFLAAYNGASGHKDSEFWLSKASALFAFGIALFPTASQCPTLLAPSWTIALTEVVGLVPMNVHYVCAILLFVCLTVMMMFFEKRAKEKGRTGRARFYKCVWLAMVFGISGTWLLSEFVFESTKSTLYAECVGLILFGIGWLRAGTYKN